jgi:hypothetical protein
VQSLRIVYLFLCNHCTIVSIIELLMPTLVRLNNCKVCIFAGDHAPPHFHVVGPGWKVTVEITTLEILSGRGPRVDLREAMEWALQAENLVSLVNEWVRLNERD